MMVCRGWNASAPFAAGGLLRSPDFPRRRGGMYAGRSRRVPDQVISSLCVEGDSLAGASAFSQECRGNTIMATCQRAERVSVRQGTRPRIHVSRKNLPVGHPAGGAGPRSRTSRLSQKACRGDSHSTPNRTEPREGPCLAFRLGGITAHYILLGESLPGQRKLVCSNDLVPCWRICEYCPSLQQEAGNRHGNVPPRS